MSVIGPFPTYRPDDLLNPLAWWKFNDGSGSNAVDSSGNGYTLAFTATPAWGTGPNGNGDVITDGTMYGANASAGNFGTSQDFSITLWVNAVDLSNFPALVSRGFFQSYGYVLVIRSDGSITCDTFGTGVTASIGSGAGQVSTGSWRHIAIVRTGSGTGGKVYSNANNVTTVSQDTSVMLPAPSEFEVCAKESGGSKFNGAIDDVRLYGVALSQSQVTAIYLAGAA